MKFTGEHLQFLRTIKKVKQPVLARKLGVKQQSISKLENKPSVGDKRFHEYIAALNLEKEEALSLLKLFTPPPTFQNEQ
ncbi:MAG: helix-turn-helix transcriptional regulator [Chitinophagaceae bacterium]|nr:helix-turn-helix transcriptional regulator [Chitinophagaceae bacterium]